MKFNLEQRIIHNLLLKSHSMEDLGLLYGKMGIATFWLYYGNLLSNDIYIDAGGDLLDEVLNKISKSTSVGFASGLCGIGWGVEFLIQHNMVDGYANEVCEDIDKEIMNRDIRRLSDLSLDTGLEGMLCYILSHISGSMKQQTNLPFDDMYLQDVYSVVKLIDVKNSNDSLTKMSQMYIDFIENRTLTDYAMNLEPFVGDVNIDEGNLIAYPLSLKEGIVGYLISRLNGKCNIK